MKAVKGGANNLTNLDVFEKFSNAFVKGFIFTALVCLSLTGLYF